MLIVNTILLKPTIGEVHKYMYFCARHMLKYRLTVVDRNDNYKLVPVAAWWIAMNWVKILLHLELDVILKPTVVLNSRIDMWHQVVPLNIGV